MCRLSWQYICLWWGGPGFRHNFGLFPWHEASVVIMVAWSEIFPACYFDCTSNRWIRYHQWTQLRAGTCVCVRVCVCVCVCICVCVNIYTCIAVGSNPFHPFHSHTHTPTRTHPHSYTHTPREMTREQFNSL